MFSIHPIISRSLVLISSLLFVVIGIAQTGREEFYRAAEIRKQADKIDKKDPVEADKLYTQANKIYPGICLLSRTNTAGIIDYLPKLRMKMGDVRGAHLAIQQVIDMVTNMNEYIFYPEVYNRFGTTRSDNTRAKSEVLRELLLLRSEINLYWGDFELARKDIFRLLEFDLTKKEYAVALPGWNYQVVSMENVTKLAHYVALLCEDSEMLKRLRPLFEKMGVKEYLELTDLYLLYLEGNDDAALKKGLELEDGNMIERLAARELLCMLYARKGDLENAEEYVSRLKKNFAIGKNQTARFSALIELKKKRFEKAIEYSNEALKPSNILWKKYEKADKFLNYYIRAEAYAGLKQLDKAKSDYEAALIYNPTFTAAINGLAKLEAQVVNQRIADKEPPAITITEPAISRGLKPKSSLSEIVIKGIASDPGGVRFVAINGEKIFSKENGEFWGPFELKSGDNKIIVSATDFSGNKSDYSIDIEFSLIGIAEQGFLKEGKNYALLIGCQNYEDASITSLEQPIPDAVKLKLILKNNYSFQEDNIFTLFNPGLRDIKKQFIELMEILEPEDNLIIFYAGHGVWVESEKKGYWMLTDAIGKDVNTWLPNKEVLDWIAKFPSRHTLLITDACFSGSVFKTRGFDPNASAAIQQMRNKISRVAITSGNDTEVPDQSVFMKHLIKALTENKEKFLTAQKMFINHIIEAVMSESKIEPRYGTLELAGHVGGDFIFSKK